MDEWQESGPGSDPRYVDRDSSWLGRNKLRIAAIVLLVGIIVTAVELFRPREPELPLDVADMIEPAPQPETDVNFAERLAEAYLPEKSPASLDLSPEGGPSPSPPMAAPAESRPASPPELHSQPPSVPLPPSVAPAATASSEPALAPASATPPPSATPAAAKPAPVAVKPAPATAKPSPADKTKPAAADRPVAKNDGNPKTLWVINMVSSPESSDAERVFKKLRDSGHKVYSYQAEVDGRIWHRVRIGFFTSQAEARKIGEDLAKHHNLPTPWVVRPGPDELKTYKN